MPRRRRFEIAISVPLALEYEGILVRHSADPALNPAEAQDLVSYLCKVARKQDVHFLWRPPTADPADEFVLELAVAANCGAIITHNARHFAAARVFNIAVLKPGEFLLRLKEAR